MASRGEELAQQLEEQMEALAKVIEEWPDDAWTKAVGEEGWTVAATAQHVSGQFPLEMEYITACAEGREMPPHTWEDINTRNDTRAEHATMVSKADVIAELREKGSVAADYVRGLSDEQLDRKAMLPLADGAAVSTQQLIEGGVLIDHVRAHTASIKAAR